MERKEALEYISSKINEGQSKRQIYQDLLPKIRYKTDLLAYISEFSDLKSRNQNKKESFHTKDYSADLIMIN